MDKKSREEKFKAMKLPELKFYLQNRGISVNSYLKPGLVAIACAVEEMNLPVLCQTSEADEKLSISRRLNLYDVQLPDPFKMDVLNDFKHSPPFGLFDIFNHLIYHSSEYDKQGLAAYKSYENYRLFYDGYVESLLTIHRKDAGVHVYVGKVKPTMKDKTKDGKEFYDLWFVLEGKGSNRGSVLDAYCACLGGRDGGCKHVAAALYSLDDLLNTKGEDSITSKPCQWIRRPKPDTTPCELKDLSVRKRGLKDHEETKRKRSREYTFSQYIEHDPRPLSDRTPCTQERLATLVTSIEKMKEKPAILPILKQKLIGSDKGKDGNTTGMKVAPEKHGIMEKKLIQHIESNNQANADSFLGSLEFSEEEIDNVASLTKKQWQCKEWYVHKRGFITASKAKNVYTRQISAERQPETDVSVLVKSLTQQKDVSVRQNIMEDPKNPLDWGLKHEESARKAYYRLESSKHNQLSLISKGLMISKTRPFLGASPDNITSCKCTPQCERIVVEYKCPWSHKDLDPKEAFLQPEIGGMWQNDTFFLQEKSRYFYQIQLLMHVTELKKCDLVVWTQKGIFCHRIMYAPLFFEKICIKLKRFWLTSVVPHMLESFCSYSKFSGEKVPKEESADKPDVELNQKGSSSPTDEKIKIEVIHSPVVDTVQKVESFSCETGINDTEKISKPNSNGQTKSIVFSEFDIREDDINSLKPRELITDAILSVMISDHCCQFPVVDTLFYSILVGDQELKVRTSTRLERIEVAERYLKASCLEKDYVFVPMNRRHILILDSLTWDIEIRRSEFDNISRYLNYMFEKHSTIKRTKRSNQILKVPQQQLYSNNCAVYVSLFIKHFLEDIDKYEEFPEKYTAEVHKWFSHEHATRERQHWHRMLQTLLDLHTR